MKNINRNPLISGLLSLVMPGLGHLYCFNVKSAILIYLIWFITPFAFYLLGFFNKIETLIIAISVTCLLWIFIIIDSVVLASKTIHYELKYYNNKYIYFTLIVFHLVLNGIVQIAVNKCLSLEAYRVDIIPDSNISSFISYKDCVIINKSPKAITSLQKGDIILYSTETDRLLFGKITHFSDDIISIGNNSIIPSDNIIGKCIYIYWPLNRIENL